MITEKLKKAKKDWICTECKGAITKGTVYNCINHYQQFECISCATKTMVMHMDCGTNLTSDQKKIKSFVSGLILKHN